MNKTRYILTLFLTVVLAFGNAVAQKAMTPPRVMIVPDMVYCKNHGYIKTFDNMGVAEEVPDYEKALNEDPSLHSVMTQIAHLMTNESPSIVIVDLNEAVNMAREDAAMSASNGGDLSESVDEAIIRNSNADVLVKVQFDLLRTGPQYRVAYTIRATDAYTGQTFAPFEGMGPNATESNPVVLLRESILGGMPSFMNKILSHYRSVIEKGRMVAVDIKTTATSSCTMSSRLGDLSLREHIDDFMYDNTVDGSGIENVRTGETFMQYQGVYIPLTCTVRGRQRRQGARDVAQRLVNYLNTLGVQAEYKSKGLGKVNVYIK